MTIVFVIGGILGLSLACYIGWALLQAASQKAPGPDLPPDEGDAQDKS